MFTHFVADLRAIKKNDPAARHWLEIITCYPGLHAIWLHRIAHLLWRLRLKWLARFIGYLSRAITNIEIHPAAKLAAGVFIDHGTGVVIGETAEVGTNCTIYQGVTLGGTSTQHNTKRHPTLKEGVIVGAGAQVLGPITVGNYSKIGSNAVVLHSIPENATAVGNPARLVQKKSTRKQKDPQDFCAYGIKNKSDDPLWQEVQKHKREIESLKKALAQKESVPKEESPT